MKDISLKDLLEAGCHFGHKVTKWHPRAKDYIYMAREGVHIIDLAKTRDELKKSGQFFYDCAKENKIILMVASKRQAKGVVTEAAKRAELPFLTNRWIGGFLTNWDEVKKNIDKMNRMRKEKQDGIWNEFPKHEIVKLSKHLRKAELVYSGVAQLDKLPDVLFIVDINKEVAALREVIRRQIPVVAIVDTNVDPANVDFAIPANDDAVGSIQLIVNYLADCYLEGKKIAQKGEGKTKKVEKEEKAQRPEKVEEKSEKKGEQKEERIKVEEKGKKDGIKKKASKKVEKEKPKKRGRPKKTT